MDIIIIHIHIPFTYRNMSKWRQIHLNPCISVDAVVCGIILWSVILFSWTTNRREGSWLLRGVLEEWCVLQHIWEYEETNVRSSHIHLVHSWYLTIISACYRDISQLYIHVVFALDQLSPVGFSRAHFQGHNMALGLIQKFHWYIAHVYRISWTLVSVVVTMNISLLRSPL